MVELWADRTSALGARPDVDYVLVFENRGPEVGATIAHPHGQIYALDRVPSAPATELAAGAWGLRDRVWMPPPSKSCPSVFAMQSSGCRPAFATMFSAWRRNRLASLASTESISALAA